MGVEGQVIFNLWNELQNYVRDILPHQDLSKGKKEIGDEFEKIVQGWVGRIHRTLRLTYNLKRGFSGTKHEFDLIAAIPQDSTTRNNGLLFECKTLYLRQMAQKQALTDDYVYPLLLTRQSVMTFLMKSYDAYPEGFFGTMFLKKVYPVIVSAKPLTRQALKFAIVYGVIVVQPSRESFASFTEEVGRVHNIDFTRQFFEEVNKKAVFYPPLQVPEMELQTLVNKITSLKEKDEMDLLRLGARIRELRAFLKRQRREIGSLPKRKRQFLNLYDFEIYRKYLDHVKQATSLKNEISQRYVKEIGKG